MDVRTRMREVFELPSGEENASEGQPGQEHEGYGDQCKNWQDDQHFEDRSQIPCPSHDLTQDKRDDRKNEE